MLFPRSPAHSPSLPSIGARNGNCIVVKQQGGNGNGNEPVRTSVAGDSATGDSTTGDSTPSNPKAGGSKDAGSCTDGRNSKGGGNNSRVVGDADATSYLASVSSGSAVGVSTQTFAKLSLIFLLAYWERVYPSCFCKSTSP